ncbi:glycosyltransferase family 4 protein [Patescibacteria group bacterium]
MPKSPKAVLITKFPYSSRFGGGERHTIDIAEALRVRGFNIHFVGSCRILRDELRRRRFPTQRLWAGIEPVTPWSILLFPLLAPFIFIGLVGTLVYYRFIRRVRILYCLSLTEKLLLPLFARMIGIRVFFMEHRMLDRWLTKNPLRFLYTFQSIFSSVITVSGAQARQCEDIGVKKGRIHTIHNGIDLKMFPWPRARAEQHPAFIIGTVAGLEPGKGIAYLLKALADLKEQIPQFRALIVGSGPERAKLVWLSRQLRLRECVQWVGFQRDVHRWYSHFDIFVLPSVKAESFGIVLLEAMAAGVPVIATRLGGVPEVVDDGRTGFLVPPSDAKAITEKILYLYHHRERIPEVVENARKSVELHFRHDTMIRNFIKLFEEAV